MVQLVALLLVAAAGAFMLFGPSYHVAKSDSAGNSTVTTASILEVVGPWVLVLVLIPVVVTLAPLLVPPGARQWVTVAATVLLAGWIVAGIWTIGGFYVPAFLCMLASVFLRPRSRPGTRQTAVV